MKLRKFPRRDFIGKVVIKTKHGKSSAINSAYITDVSCTGVSIMEDNSPFISDLKVGDVMDLVLKIHGKILKMQLKVEWKKEAAMGCCIDQIDEDNFSIWLDILNALFKK